ncbi:MAG: DUF1385 domain-containing protein [Candidatus Eisenbacteria bacterium]|uniref:DUF1385 domain-containing protein n=1 Tax=Eiseniibacteriota bacterium TaxID=2212470 RepID=A0A9D6LC28_UNCEI|nr:DUF1385 domain-containing protein [Candidatus Eisenbacteria bacterium]MBI3540378.1 DUF1385 domain-containing protein [Candidatus Eisenbacteria bacterium]
MPFLPVGGQAVIEGVMMRSPSRIAVAVRRGDGSLGYLERPFVSITRRVPVLGWPVIRGAVSLFETLYLGITALNFSADEATRDEAAPASGDEAVPASAAARKPSPLASVAQGATILFSLALGILLFVVLPARVTSWLGFHDRIGFGLVDGGFRLLAFVLYLLLISQWKELRRVLMYHGAEHKAIHALEHRAPLTPESVQTFSRLHPRCGTSFLFLVIVVSIVVFTFIGRPQNLGQHLLRIACMPLIAGVAFEFIRISGKYADRPVVRWLVWPGMQFQRLTTREPDLSMCAVAIAALERVRGDEIVVALERAGDAARADVAFVQ